MIYIVFKQCNFEPKRELHKFDNYAVAKEYLQEAWEDTFNTELADPWSENYLDFDQCFHEDDYAVITTYSGEMIEWFLFEAIEGRG